MSTPQTASTGRDCARFGVASKVHHLNSDSNPINTSDSAQIDPQKLDLTTHTHTPPTPPSAMNALGEWCVGVRVSESGRDDTHNHGQPESACMASPPCNVFTLTIRSEGHHLAPVAVRLRRALKLLLRSFGLRCVSIAQTINRGNP